MTADIQEIIVFQTASRFHCPGNNQSLFVSFLVIILMMLSACQSESVVMPPPPVTDSLISESEDRLDSQRPFLPEVVNFNHLSLEDGLSQSTVTAIHQDRQGFIWLGTMDGLNRFDGYEFTTFKHDPVDPNSIGANHITSLYEDVTGNIWIGTSGGGVAKFYPTDEHFEIIQQDVSDPASLSSNYVTSIVGDEQGSLWLGTENGLNQVNAQTGEVKVYPVEYDYTFENGSNAITVLKRGSSGLLWVGTPSGLLSFDHSNERFHEHVLLEELPPRARITPTPVEIVAIHEDPDGLIWAGARDEGLFRLEPVSGKVSQFLHNSIDSQSLSSNTVTALIEDPSGFIWVGTGNGLNLFDRNRELFVHFFHSAANEHSLSDDEVTSIYFDQAGILWVGTHLGGANTYDPYKVKFRHIGPGMDDGLILSHPQVWTFLEDQDHLWVGTSNGLDRYDIGSGLTSHYLFNPLDNSSLSDNHITKIITDRQGEIWIATYGGLNKYDAATDSFERHLTRPGYPATLDDQINNLYEDAESKIWIGTAGNGLSRLDPQSGKLTQFRFQSPENSQEQTSINSILSFAEDDSGLIWIGTMGGLMKYDPAGDIFSVYRHHPQDPGSIGSNVIHAIHPDQQDSLWLATGNGLDNFNPITGVFNHYREGDGLPNNGVAGILEDSSGQLWLSTINGMARFDPESKVFRNFDTGDGLQSLEFNSGAAYQNPEGELYFGGINGFNIIRPELVKENLYSPPVIVTEFRIKNEPVQPGGDSPLERVINHTKQIELSRSDNVFSFELAALHFENPKQNQYAYFMQGFDQEWNFIGNRRNATYTNLPPGDYTFLATGTNSDGVWSNQLAEIKIFMPYPFWQTWWFAGMLAVFIAAAIYGGYRLRTRSTLVRTRELEQQVAIRTVEIERRQQIAEGLREIMVQINSNKSVEESLHYIVSQAAKLTEAEDAIIFRKGESNPMTIVATNPGGQIRYSPNVGLATITEDWAGKALLENEPLIIEDLVVYWLANPEVRAGSFGSHKAMLGIPVVVNDQIYGGLIMLYDHERSFSEEDLDLGFTFADQATLAIANNWLRQQAEQIAVATERSRLARELHDAVTQTIFSASLIAETVPPIWEADREEGEKLLRDLRQLTRGALAEMRTLLLELRPTALEEAALPDLLHQLAESVGGRTGIQVETSAEISCDIPVSVKVALYRIAQESLNNIMKHSRASHVEINLSSCDESTVSLTINDDGRGFDIDNVPADRLGLSSMRERAQAMNALLTIESELNKGTIVSVEWTTLREGN